MAYEELFTDLLKAERENPSPAQVSVQTTDANPSTSSGQALGHLACIQQVEAASRKNSRTVVLWEFS